LCIENIYFQGLKNKKIKTVFGNILGIIISGKDESGDTGKVTLSLTTNMHTHEGTVHIMTTCMYANCQNAELPIYMSDIYVHVQRTCCVEINHFQQKQTNNNNTKRKKTK